MVDAPWTPIQKILAEVWSAVLEAPDIGMDDRFDELGGDSLLSLQIAISLQERGLPATLDDLYRCQTIAELSEAIEARQRGPKSPEPASLVGAAPLTGNQSWILQQPDFMYSVSAIVLAPKQTGARPIDAALLERAAQYLTFHHDALRLRCQQSDDGSWVAEYAAHTPPGLVSVLDLSALHAADRPARVTEEFGRVQKGIDVEAGPLVRIGLIRLGEAGDLVGVGIHHIISDTISAAILIRDLDAAYAALASGEQPSLPPRTARVDRWLERNAELAASRDVRREAVYWIDTAAHERTGLPVDFPEQPGSVGRVDVVPAWFGRERTARLRHMGRLGLSLADLVHYALARALSEVVRSSTVQFRTMSHGRAPVGPDVDVSRSVGFLARDFPLVLAVDDGTDPLAGAGAVRAQLRAIPNHGIGYRILLDHADRVLSRRLRSGAAPPIELNYDGDQDHLFGGLTVFRRTTEWQTSPAMAESDAATVPWHSRLELTASIEEKDLLFWVTYHAGAYRRATIERFADRMFEILAEVIDCARQRGADLELVT
jgi:non-ribosomal peptide synthase protein (TIGR01720 family)